jgi:hypothetical protein
MHACMHDVMQGKRNVWMSLECLWRPDSTLVYTYIRIYIYINTHTYIHTYIHTRMCIHLYTLLSWVSLSLSFVYTNYIHTYIFSLFRTHTYVFSYCAHVHVHSCSCFMICTSMRTSCMHARMHVWLMYVCTCTYVCTLGRYNPWQRQATCPSERQSASLGF